MRILSAGALCYAAARWVGDVGLNLGFIGRVGLIGPYGAVGSLPLALARLVSFAGSLLGPFGALPSLFARAAARGPPPRAALLAGAPAPLRRPPLPSSGLAPSFRSRPSLRRGCGAFSPLGERCPPWAGAAFRLRPCGRILQAAPALGVRFSSSLRSGFRLPAARLSVGLLCPPSLSSSSLLPPAGAPRCALPALGLAPCVLPPFGWALPPRVGVPCLPAVGIPDARRECGRGFWVVWGFLLGRVFLAPVGGSDVGLFTLVPLGAAAPKPRFLGLPPSGGWRPHLS